MPGELPKAGNRKKTAESFYEITPQTYMIGDCEKPRKIQEATMEGCTIAAAL